MINSVAILYGLKQFFFGPRLSSHTVPTFSDTVQRPAELMANVNALCFESWRKWALAQSLIRDGFIESVGLIRIEVPRTAPLMADAGEGSTTAYESCTDGGTLDTDEGTDEDAAAAPDASSWPDTDDGF